MIRAMRGRWAAIFCDSVQLGVCYFTLHTVKIDRDTVPQLGSIAHDQMIVLERNVSVWSVFTQFCRKATST
jgi:hypothetical protein